MTPEPTLPTNLSSVTVGQVPGAAPTTVAAADRPGRGRPQRHRARARRVRWPAPPSRPTGWWATRWRPRTTTTAADGSWTIGAVLGGRYRVRAWQQPSLAVTTPQIFFLGGTESRSLTIQLTSFTGPNVAAAIAPGHTHGRPAGQPGGAGHQPHRRAPTAWSATCRTPASASPSPTGPLWQVANGNPLTTGRRARCCSRWPARPTGSYR